MYVYNHNNIVQDSCYSLKLSFMVLSTFPTGIVVVLMVLVLILIVKHKKSPKDTDEIVRRHSDTNHRLPSRSDQFLNPMHNKNVRNTEYKHQSRYNHTVSCKLAGITSNISTNYSFNLYIALKQTVHLICPYNSVNQLS